MKEYLKDKELNEIKILHIICGAPVSLNLKYEFLKELKDYYEIFQKAFNDTEKALKELRLKKENEFFYFKGKMYDTKSFLTTERGYEPCFSVKKAIEILNNDGICTEDLWKAYNENCCWSELEKWVINGKNFDNTYTYFLIKNEVCYYERYGCEENSYFSIYGRVQLNLPTPFKPGDIIETDCLPFAPKKVAVITDIGDNRDCCSLQAISKNYKNIYSIGAVKHAHMYCDDNAFLTYSPLYCIEKFGGDLTKIDKQLLKISKYISRNHFNGPYLAEKLSKFNEVREEEIKELLLGAD